MFETHLDGRNGNVTRTSRHHEIRAVHQARVGGSASFLSLHDAVNSVE